MHGLRVIVFGFPKKKPYNTSERRVRHLAFYQGINRLPYIWTLLLLLVLNQEKHYSACILDGIWCDFFLVPVRKTNTALLLLLSLWLWLWLVCCCCRGGCCCCRCRCDCGCGCCCGCGCNHNHSHNNNHNHNHNGNDNNNNRHNNNSTLTTATNHNDNNNSKVVLVFLTGTKENHTKSVQDAS